LPSHLGAKKTGCPRRYDKKKSKMGEEGRQKRGRSAGLVQAAVVAASSASAPNAMPIANFCNIDGSQIGNRASRKIQYLVNRRQA